MDRTETIRRIRTGLRQRTGKDWSVTGGRGTAWGWLTISAPPRRRINGGTCLTEADRKELGAALGLGRPAGLQGESVPASESYWREFVDRAEGRTPSVRGRPYWD